MIHPALAVIVQLVRKPAHQSQAVAADFCIVQGTRKWLQRMGKRVERDSTVIDTPYNLCAFPCEADDDGIPRSGYWRISMDDAVGDDFGQTQIHVSGQSRRHIMGFAQLCYPMGQALELLQLGPQDDL